MLSKQAFNALLKTLEEPPKYLKFIFATTEIKKIPVTVISRCQRFDLSRVKSEELFNYIKMIKDKEGGKVSDEALKLIVKISEGSVRDALSLLDRGLVANQNNEELNLDKAQSIYGYFDKSSLIELIKNLFSGDEKKVFELYKKIYDSGVDPKIFLNDFLEVLYYLKNINFIKLDGNNFSLNDQDFSNLSTISENLDSKDIILFWQFTIKTLGELDIVSNQNLTIEMFLLRLIYLAGVKENKPQIQKKLKDKTSEKIELPEIKSDGNSNSNKTINQIKNITQNRETEPKKETSKTESINTLKITSFDDLIKICNENKEIKLKYELENNVNLVKFEKLRIEISFNEKLDKNFIKDLTFKLQEWTGERWIITLSKATGEISLKEKLKKEKNQKIETIQKSKFFLDLKEKFPDIKLIDIKEKSED